MKELLTKYILTAFHMLSSMFPRQEFKSVSLQEACILEIVYFKHTGSGVRLPRFQARMLPQTICVLLGMLFDLSEFQFSHL